MEKLNRESHLSNKGYSTPLDNLSKPRHRWYYYKEGFSNNLVNYAIEEVNFKKGDIIFDPFVGSGTVNLCASQKGIPSIGIEVNPFACFLSQTKHINLTPTYLRSRVHKDAGLILKGIEKEKQSPLLTFSTFSECSGLDKWLFHSGVLNGFEGGYRRLSTVDREAAPFFKLALLQAAMENCNAKKDGKCLRYKSNWIDLGYDKYSLQQSFLKSINMMVEDLQKDFLAQTTSIYQSDSRNFLNSQQIPFKLCITSPPYLNSFDYTDVYRPELFLGRFIPNQEKLKELRSKTLCSHINFRTNEVASNRCSVSYNKVVSELNKHKDQFWNCRLSHMVQTYFSQMEDMLAKLFRMGKQGSQLWIVVANSAYYNQEIPTDLVLADIGANIGWKLKEITVLRDVFKRGSKYSPDIHSLRESAIVFQKK